MKNKILYWYVKYYIDLDPGGLNLSPCCRSASLRIRINLSDLDPFLSDSGSGSYANEHDNNINWKEKFKNVCLLFGPGGRDKENQVEMYKKYCLLRYITSLKQWRSRSGLNNQTRIRIKMVWTRNTVKITRSKRIRIRITERGRVEWSDSKNIEECKLDG
jgi:hypothetical protein